MSPYGTLLAPHGTDTTEPRFPNSQLHITGRLRDSPNSLRSWGSRVRGEAELRKRKAA